MYLRLFIYCGNVYTHMADLVTYLNDRQNDSNNSTRAIFVDQTTDTKEANVC